MNDKIREIMNITSKRPAKTRPLCYKDETIDFDIRVVEQKRVLKTRYIDVTYQLTIRDKSGMVCMQIKTPCYNEIELYIRNYILRGEQ